MYHYGANNPVKYTDLEGRLDVAWSQTYGNYNIYIPIKSIDTGNNVVDNIIAPFAGSLNILGGCLNVLSNGVGGCCELIDSGTDFLDEHIPWEYTLTGNGIKQDLLALEAVGMANPQLIADGLACLSSASKYLATTKGVSRVSNTTKLSATDIVFSDKFSKPAYKGQVAKRGWSTEKIANTINNPLKTSLGINKATGNSVTRYYIDDIHYVAQDNVTKKIIQVADLNDSNWK